MSAAEKIAPTVTEPLSWAEICKRHPDEWVCLVEIQQEIDRPIAFARVVAHGQAIAQALDQLGTSNPDATIMHTRGRPLQTPRIELVDESRDLLRSHR